MSEEKKRLAVEAVGLQKAYGKKKIIRDASFLVPPGCAAAFVGDNGCGKSTLMKVISGVIQPDAGELFSFGRDQLRTRRKDRRQIGYLPQENPLYEELSVRDNLKLWVPDKRAYDELVRAFALKDIQRQRVSSLSGGMKRRLSIACAVAEDPPVLCMDEPTSALDLHFQHIIREWIQSHLERGGTVLMATHNEAEIAMCGLCFLMKDGVIIKQR